MQISRLRAWKLTQKHHRQVSLSVKAPPSNGPTTAEIPNMLESDAMKIGRCFSGTLKPTIVRPPEKRPLAPAPATARPTMSIDELLAAAHKTEPNSKITIATIYVYLTLKYV